jgi:hypothetical protein
MRIVERQFFCSQQIRTDEGLFGACATKEFLGGTLAGELVDASRFGNLRVHSSVTW